MSEPASNPAPVSADLGALVARAANDSASSAKALLRGEVMNATPIRFSVEGVAALAKRLDRKLLTEKQIMAEVTMNALAWFLESIRNPSKYFDEVIATGLGQTIEDDLRMGSTVKKAHRQFLADALAHAEIQQRGVVVERNAYVQLKPSPSLRHSRVVWVSGVVLHLATQFFSDWLERAEEDAAAYDSACCWIASLRSPKMEYPTNAKQLKLATKRLAGNLLGLTPAEVDERLHPRKARPPKVFLALA